MSGPNRRPQSRVMKNWIYTDSAVHWTLGKNWVALYHLLARGFEVINTERSHLSSQTFLFPYIYIYFPYIYISRSIHCYVSKQKRKGPSSDNASDPTYTSLGRPLPVLPMLGSCSFPPPPPQHACDHMQTTSSRSFTQIKLFICQGKAAISFHIVQSTNMLAEWHG